MKGIPVICSELWVKEASVLSFIVIYYIPNPGVWTHLVSHFHGPTPKHLFLTCAQIQIGHSRRKPSQNLKPSWTNRPLAAVFNMGNWQPSRTMHRDSLHLLSVRAGRIWNQGTKIKHSAASVSKNKWHSFACSVGNSCFLLHSSWNWTLLLLRFWIMPCSKKLGQ